MHLVILAVGLGLAAFYTQRGLPQEVSAVLQQSPDRIFPYFIATEIPPGISGLFFAAIFAAAISTLDSTLAESADLSVRHIYEKLQKNKRSENHYLLVSRVILIFWGFVFFAVTLLFARFADQGLLDLTFKLPSYVAGISFATIVLARFRIGSFRSFLIGGCASCICVYVLQTNSVAFLYWCPAAGLIMLTTVWLIERKQPELRGIVGVKGSD